MTSEPVTTSSASTIRALVSTVSFIQAVFLSQSAAEPVPGFHHEGRAGLRLDEQREAVERYGLGERRGEDLVDRGAHARQVGVGDAAGQRHVEAEGLEDVRVAPLAEVAELVLRQRVGIAARDVGLRQRRAETVECLDDFAGETVELGRQARPAPAPGSRRAGRAPVLPGRPARRRPQTTPAPRRARLRSCPRPARRAPSASHGSRSGARSPCDRRSRPATAQSTAGAGGTVPVKGSRPSQLAAVRASGSS